MSPLTEAENRLRLDLYQQGKDDTEIANILGLTPGSIWYWRKARGLPLNNKNGPVSKRTYKNLDRVAPMEQVLDPDQCEAMRRFLGCLVTFSDRFPGKKIDILMFAREYRKGVGEVG